MSVSEIAAPAAKFVSSNVIMPPTESPLLRPIAEQFVVQVDETE